MSPLKPGPQEPVDPLLLLPIATAPRLAQAGAPVTYRDGHRTLWRCILAEVLPTTHGGTAYYLWRLGSNTTQSFPYETLESLDGVSLDLSRIAGRNLAAMDLARRWGGYNDLEENIYCTAPWWEPAKNAPPCSWRLGLGMEWFGFVAPESCPGAVFQKATVPALADLRPRDDRRLGDGSRWVDARALALTCAG